MGVMKVDTGFNLHNKFEIEVVDIKTGKVKQKETIYNIVVNQMFTRLCAGNTYFTGISYGTGTGTPDVSRTGLFTYLGHKAADIIETKKDFVNNEFFIRKRIQIMPEEHVGSYLTEVGVAYGTGNSITTHALITDSEGHPISIYKTDLDVINIYATVYIDPQFSDPNIRLRDGLFMNYILAQNTSLFTTCGVTAYPSIGDAFNSNQALASSFTADTANKRRTSGVMRFTINQANWPILQFRLNGDVAHIFMPIQGAYERKSRTRLLGMGDGVKTKFALPDYDVDLASVQMFLGDTAEMGFVAERIQSVPWSKMNVDTGLAVTGNGVSYSPDGQHVAVAHLSGQGISFYYWNSTNGRYERLPNVDTGLAGTGNGVSYSPDGQHVAVAHAGGQFISFYYWNSTNGRYERLPNVDTGLISTGFGVSYSPDGQHVAVAHAGGQGISFYLDAKTGTEVTFDTPPAVGVEVKSTHDVTNNVPKDSDHVFDIQYRIQLGTP